jgi:hypothetical protein
MIQQKKFGISSHSLIAAFSGRDQGSLLPAHDQFYLENFIEGFGSGRLITHRNECNFHADPELRRSVSMSSAGSYAATGFIVQFSRMRTIPSSALAHPIDWICCSRRVIYPFPGRRRV